MLIAAASTGRRLMEAGFVVGGLGSLALVWSGVMTINASTDTRRRRGFALIAAGLLLGVSFALQIAGILAK